MSASATHGGHNYLQLCLYTNWKSYAACKFNYCIKMKDFSKLQLTDSLVILTGRSISCPWRVFTELRHYSLFQYATTTTCSQILVQISLTYRKTANEWSVISTNVRSTSS